MTIIYFAYLPKVNHYHRLLWIARMIGLVGLGILTLSSVGGDGATCQHIIDHMVTHDPDMTRLLDRLQNRGFVMRERCQADRRVVRCYLTKSGLTFVGGPSSPLS